MRRLRAHVLDTSGASAGDVLTVVGGVAQWAVGGGGGGGGGATSLDGLTDVTVTSPATGQVIRWDGSAFVNASLVVGDVAGLGDALMSKSDTGHTHAGYAPVAHTHAGYAPVAHTHTLDSLSDVDTVTRPPEVGDFITWDGTGWRPGTPAHREVMMASGVTPPEPLVSSDGYDWIYGEVPA